MEKHLENDLAYRQKNFDENYKYVLEKIEAAANKVGKTKEDIMLLAATKTVPVELINYAADKGLTLMGENRVQEFLSKQELLDEKLTRHFIGHLQKNKVKQIVGKVSLIHSVDSLALAEEISKRSLDIGICSDILVEVNIADEQSKSGVSKENAENLIREIAKLEGVKVCGLMAIPPICQNDEEISQFFAQMSKLYIDISHKNIDNINMIYLSMGMSSDFEQAILNGANIIRVGSLLFGDRNYN